MTDGVLIRARNIKKSYQMGEITQEVLKGIDFDLYEGEMIVVLGPSGSGKSTLMNIIGGMDTVSEGELYYRDQPLHLADEKRLTRYRREVVGFVFQFFNLIPNLTALENIKLAMDLSAHPLAAEEILLELGVLEQAHQFPSQLSGGQQQRIAIARAIAKNPDLLLCDEPTGALDLETGIQVLKYIRKLNRERNKTVMLITHNAEIAEMADRVFYLRDGRISRERRVEKPLEPEEVRW